MNEDQIYEEHQDKRRTWKTILFCLVGLLGLLGGLYYLNTVPPEPPFHIEEVTHQCAHPGCKEPHPVVAEKTFPDGTGGAVLVGCFFIYCAIVIGISTTEKL